MPGSELTVSAILFVVGLVNFAPVLGLRSDETLARAYGIATPGGDLAVLLRHRAALFGIVGGFILFAAFVPTLQLAAVVIAYSSMLSYIALARNVGSQLARVRRADAVATGLLTIVPIIWMLSGLPG